MNSKKNYVILKRVLDFENYYLTSKNPPYHFDVMKPEMGEKFTLNQAIKITRQLNKDARETFSYSLAYGYHTI